MQGASPNPPQHRFNIERPSPFFFYFYFLYYSYYSFFLFFLASTLLLSSSSFFFFHSLLLASTPQNTPSLPLKHGKVEKWVYGGPYVPHYVFLIFDFFIIFLTFFYFFCFFLFLYTFCSALNLKNNKIIIKQ